MLLHVDLDQQCGKRYTSQSLFVEWNRSINLVRMQESVYSLASFSCADGDLLGLPILAT